MAFDPTVKHPSYIAFAPSWMLMRDAFDGEDAVKARGEVYLPMKSGTKAIKDVSVRQDAYDAYRLRAEFPEIVAPTIRGAVGVMLDQPAAIELPSALEPLRLRATRDGLSLNALHRRIAVELMTVGRFGLLPGISQNGDPYLAGYVAESIINWDSTNMVPDYVMLDESGKVRDRVTGAWGDVKQYRECFVADGRYGSRVWTEGATGWDAGEVVEAANRKRQPLDTLPFVFIDTSDLSPEPDDVPLYGLAKLAMRVYRLDADYSFALHMTSEPTPVAIGFDDPATAVTEGRAPTTLGSSKLWLLPSGGDAKYLEFTGPGLEAQKNAIQDALGRAVMFGAQVLIDTQRTAESGEAIRLRLGHQTSILKTIAMTSAAGLERALKNIATWLGENPDQVTVKASTDFFEHTLTPQEITALVAGWQSRAYSKQTLFERLKKGELIPADRSFEDEEDLIEDEGPALGNVPAENRQPVDQDD
ncbi:conserved hypothetical protein [Hyphomicrobiales bacterium]|nr:conserved hypothetical protein [Hyphomicrobiales bacterium]CAH1664066.1 conserved hypothetical protein [Hyphomicrobiales bacterium]